MNDEIKEILFLLHNDRLTYSGKRKLEDYITNLQQENFNLRENILIHKMSFKSDDKSLEHLINMPSYEELQQLEQEHKKINGELREENSKLEIALQNIQEDYNKRIEENERLKEQSKKDNHILGCNFASKDKYKQRYDDYKSRCEKAISKIKLLGKYDGECCTRNFKMMSADFNDLLNILQNGSDSQ